MKQSAYLIQQRETKRRLVQAAERVTQQLMLDTLQVTLHQEFGFGYDRIKRLRMPGAKPTTSSTTPWTAGRRRTTGRRNWTGSYWTCCGTTRRSFPLGSATRRSGRSHTAPGGPERGNSWESVTGSTAPRRMIARPL